MKNGKHTQRNMIWLASGLLCVVFLILVLLNIFAGEHWIDSDMAAEMIFSRLIAEEGGLIATDNWYYSTEFRILYTQLIMVPLFHIFEDWHVIRVITNVVTYVLLLGSYVYFMKPLRIKKSTVIFSAVILLLPFSETVLTHVQMGNTYMPHMMIIFFCFGMFLRLVDGGKRGKSSVTIWKKVQGYILLVCYFLLNVVCGMSGVRYVLALQAPLVLAGICMFLRSEEFYHLRRGVTWDNFLKLWIAEKMRYMWYSLLGLLGAMAGYLINIAVIAKRFQFQTYEATNFIQVFQGVLTERMQNTIGNLLMLFGYIENKGFLSLRGAISLIAFAMLVGTVLLTCRCSRLLKANTDLEVASYNQKRFILWFFIAAFVLNTFVFVFTTSTMTSRYYITVFMFVLPLICMYFEMETMPLDRILVMLFLCGALGLSSAKCVYSFVDKDKNAEEKKVAQFLMEEAYEFGYATYWNANIMTELSNGSIEVANVHEVADMSMFCWSSPKRYYEEGYHTGRTFLLLTVEEASEYQEAEAVKAGQIVYQDENYVVFHYDAVEELLQ